MLSPPGSALLGLLLPALTGRWQAVTVVADEPGVMEALALGGVSTLVVVEPSGWLRLGQLMDAVGHYYRQVVCMGYQVDPGEQSPRIAALLAGADAPGTDTDSAVDAAAGGGSASAVAAEIEIDAQEQAGGGAATAPRSAARRTPATAGPAPGSRPGATPGANGVYAIQGPGGVPDTERRRRVEALAVHVEGEPAQRKAIPEPLISEDELSMLLGPGPGEVA